MNCSKCGCETKSVTLNNLMHIEPKQGDMYLKLKKYNIPFACDECGGLVFNYQALKNIVFIWPDSLPDATRGGIIIPEKYKKFFGSEYGIVLSVGRDVKVKVNIGDRVLYDKTVPWELEVIDNLGKNQILKVMNFKDVKGVVQDGV
jgi:co-chaperonin GroES (HSP10)